MVLESVFGFSEPEGTFSTSNRYPVMKIITCQHEWVEQCQLRYRVEPPAGFHFEDAHYPEPECRNGIETVRLWYPDHIVQGALQTLNLQHPCMHGKGVHTERSILQMVYPEYLPLHGEAYTLCQRFASTGCFWVADGITEIKLSRGESVPPGFKPGRLCRAWFTNGSTDLWLTGGEEVPQGYYAGRSLMSGKNNSQYGIRYRWINNGDSNKKLQDGFPLPGGWEEGYIVSEEGLLKSKEAIVKPIELTRITTGEKFVFSSAAEAARGLDLRAESLSNACHGRQKTTKGYTARFL